ncbi:unnamed protein product [Soboliphyme baturini]|uniref:Trichohyalin-like n=1 Tax=Soboliphyme baturini TaxID=241478 RepID=A0A183J5P7_9BILA|nr:unnamed protein product [Soboliphyme baturini]
MEQEKREQLAKFKQLEKKWDHFIRAVHLEEIPLRQKEYEDSIESVRQFWEEHEVERIEKAKEERKMLLENHNRLKRIDQDAKQFLAMVREAKSAEMQKRFADWEKKLKNTRQKRLEERRKERKEKRRQAWLQEKAEEEKARRAEEENKAKEEEYRGKEDMRGRDYAFAKKPYAYGQTEDEYVPPFTRDKLGRQIEGSEPSEAMLAQLNDQNWRRAPPAAAAKTREPLSGEPEIRPYAARRMVDGGHEDAPYGIRSIDAPNPLIEASDWRSSFSSRAREAPDVRETGPPLGRGPPSMSWRRPEAAESVVNDMKEPPIRQNPFFEREEPLPLRERPSFEERRPYIREDLPPRERPGFEERRPYVRDELPPRERPGFEERRPYVRDEFPLRERPSFEDRRPYVRDEGPVRERPVYEERRPFSRGEEVPPRERPVYEDRRLYNREEPLITRERPAYEERRVYVRDEPGRVKEPTSWRRGPAPELLPDDMPPRGGPPLTSRSENRPWSASRPWGRMADRGAPAPSDVDRNSGKYTPSYLRADHVISCFGRYIPVICFKA